MPRVPRAPPCPEGIGSRRGARRSACGATARSSSAPRGATAAPAAAATALRGDREPVRAAVLRHPEALRPGALREGDLVLRLLAAADEAEGARAAEADAAWRLRDEVAEAAARRAPRPRRRLSQARAARVAARISRGRGAGCGGGEAADEDAAVVAAPRRARRPGAPPRWASTHRARSSGSSLHMERPSSARRAKKEPVCEDASR